jgi:hypothetical protein
LAYLAKLYAIPVRRDFSNHLEDSFFNFFFAYSWSLVTGNRNSLLSNGDNGCFSYIEAFVCESEDPLDHDRFGMASLTGYPFHKKENEEILVVLTLGCWPSIFGASRSTLYSRLVCPPLAQTVLLYLRRIRRI